MRKKNDTSSYAERMTMIVRAALAEDVGPGDITSVIFKPREKGTAIFLAKQPGVVSGLDVAGEVFRQLERSAKFSRVKQDGETFAAGEVLAEVSASLRTLFTGERVALNFLQRLCAVATMTRRYVDALGPRSSIEIFHTRKTTPLLRVLEKKAVIDGGGKSHRGGLYDMAMLKNNHIDAAGGVSEAVLRLRDSGFFDRRSPLPLCIEARSTAEAVEAVHAAADIVMLDNMKPNEMRRAVDAMRSACRDLGRRMPQVEISGGIKPTDVPKLRDLPINRISVGTVTHSTPAIDISMRFI